MSLDAVFRHAESFFTSNSFPTKIWFTTLSDLELWNHISCIFPSFSTRYCCIVKFFHSNVSSKYRSTVLEEPLTSVALCCPLSVAFQVQSWSIRHHQIYSKGNGAFFGNSSIAYSECRHCHCRSWNSMFCPQLVLEMISIPRRFFTFILLLLTLA